MPDEHRYFGSIFAPLGLKAAAEILAPCSWRVRKCKSGYDGTYYLESRDDRIDLEMDSGQGPLYVFSGGMVGSQELAQNLLSEFSQLLAGGSVVHRVELYRGGGNDLVAYWHYCWPWEQKEPGTPHANLP